VRPASIGCERGVRLRSAELLEPIGPLPSRPAHSPFEQLFPRSSPLAASVHTRVVCTLVLAKTIITWLQRKCKEGRTKASSSLKYSDKPDRAYLKPWEEHFAQGTVA